MTRSRTALVGLVLAAVGVAGCGGAKDATEGSVRDDVTDQLTEVGYRPGPDDDLIEVDPSDAEDIGSCVARTMFESTDLFSKEERNAATSSSDGDEPDPDLVLKVEGLVNDCYDQVVNGDGSGDGAQTSDGAGADEGTTTTEG